MSEPPIGSARRWAITVTVMPVSVLPASGGGPVIPIAQAVLWEIFPPRKLGMAMAVWAALFRLLAAVCAGLVLVPLVHRVRMDRA